jgi:hypothetical protein
MQSMATTEWQITGLTMEAVCSSEMLVSIHKSTHHYHLEANIYIFTAARTSNLRHRFRLWNDFLNLISSLSRFKIVGNKQYRKYSVVFL